MANKLTIEVLISDNGTAKLVQKGVEGVGKAAENTTKKTKEASKAQDELNYKLNQGVTGVSSAARSFSKLSQAIGNGPDGLVGAYATLAANAFAVSAAFTQLKEARGVELIMQGLAETSARTGTELTTIANRMKDVTGQAIDMADAMRYTAQLSAAGISTTDIERLTQAATAAAYNLGKEVPDAIQRLTLAVAKNEPELVDELGMTMKSTEAWRQYGLTVGKTAAQLTDQEKKLALLNGWVKQTTEAYGDLKDAVNVNEFSQLSAAFKELVRDSIQGASAFLKIGEAAQYLSSSTMGLASVMVIFLSTISKQLIPGLYNLDRASLARRNSVEKEIRLQKEQIIFAGKAAKAQNAALVSTKVEQLSSLGNNLKNARGAEVKVPTSYKEYIEAEKQGLATAQQREAAIKTLQRSQAQYNRFVDKESEAYKTASVAQREAAARIILTRQQQIDLIRETIALKQKEAAMDVANSGRIAGMQRQNVASRMQGFALGKQASAIEEMGSGSMAVGLKEGRTAIAAYSRSMQNGVIATEQLGTKIPFVTRGLAGLRVGLFAAETGVKMLGSAVLRMLPYVGWAMLAWDLFGESIMKFFGKVFEPSNVKKAAKDLETVAENATNVVTQAQKTQNDIASSARATVKSIIAEKNAIDQAYASLVKYNNEKAKEEANKNNPNRGLSPREVELKSLTKELGERRREQYNAQDEASKKRAKAAADEIAALIDAKEAADKLNKSYKIGLTDKDITDKSSLINKLYGDVTASTISAMNQGRMIPSVSKDAIKEMQVLKTIIATSKGPEYFNSLIKSQQDWEKLNHAGRMKVLEQVLGKVNAETQRVGQATADLTANTAKAKDSFQTFLQTLKPKTPFDDAVESLEGVNTSLIRVKAAMSATSWKGDKFIGLPDPAAVKKYEDSVISTAQDMNEYLTRGTKDQLDGLEKQKQAVISIASERAKLNKDDKDYASKNAALADKQNVEYAKYVDMRTQTVSTVVKELQQREALLNTARAEAITQQAITALAQARLQVLQRHGIVTAEDYKRQVDAENNIKRTQIASLEIQKKILSFKYDDLKLEMTRAKNALEDALRRNEEIKQRNIITQQMLYQQAIAEKNVEAQNKAMQAIKQLQDPNYKTPETLDLEAQYQSALNALKPYSLEMKALNMQQQAVRETMIGANERNIEAQRYSLELQNKIAGYDQKTKATLAETTKLREQIRNTIARTIPMYTNLVNAETDAKTSLSSLLSDYASQYAQNEIDLEKATANNNTSQISAYKIIRARIIDAYQAETERVRLQLQLTRQQELYIDVLSEGLEIQQKALEPMQRALDIQASIIDQRKQLRQLDAQIAAKSLGKDIDPELQRKLDILAAKESLNNAREQLGLKIEGIKLEYALLDAQRLQSQMILKARRQELAVELSRKGTPLNPEEAAMLQQMDSAIAGLSVSYERIRDSAITQAQNELKIKERELKLLETRTLPIGQGLLGEVLQAFSTLDQIKKTNEEIKQADTSSVSAYIKTVKAATVDAKTAQQLLSEAIVHYTPMQIASMDNLTKAMIGEAGRRKTSTLGSSEADKALFTRSSRGTLSGNKIVDKPSDIKMKDGAWAKPVSEELVQWTRYLQQKIPEAIVTSFNAGKHNGPEHDAADIRSSTKAQVARIKEVAEEFQRLTGIMVNVKSEITKPDGQKVWSGPHTHTNITGRFPVAGQTPGIGDDIQRHRTGRISDYANFEDFDAPLREAADRAANTQIDAATRLEGAGDKLLIAANALTSSQATSQAPEVDTRGLGSSVISKFAGGKEVGRDETSGAINSLGGRELNSSASEKLNKIDSQFTSTMSTLSEKLKSELFPEGKPLGGEQLANAIEQFKQKMQQGFIDASATANAQLKNAFPLTDLSTKINSFWSDSNIAAQPFLNSLNKLGPQGELVTSIYSGVENITKNIGGLLATLETGKAGFKDYAGAATSIMSSVGSILAAGSKAKIANIDKEIAAEQKRDGKSAESVAKIAQLQKKKEAEERKAFNRDKKLKMAETVIATAAAVMKAAPNIPKMLLMGALGAAQLAIIASSKYEGSSTTDTAVNIPSNLSIGKRSDTVDLAKGPNANAGGEVGYLRGSEGTGSNASTYRTVGSAYGGEMMRGYGNRGFVVGEKGPEVINPETPISVTPANDVNSAQPINANISIQALDGADVKRVLVDNRGNIIQMLREAANNSGQRFLEDVNVNVYTRPNIGKL